MSEWPRKAKVFNLPPDREAVLCARMRNGTFKTISVINDGEMLYVEL